MRIQVGAWASRPGFGIASSLVAYLVLLTLAELAITYVNALLVFPLDGGLIAVIAIHLAVTQGWTAPGMESKRLSGMLIAFLTAPLIRIISLTLPMGAIDPPLRYVLTGIPMLVGGALAARAAGLDRHDLGLSWRGTRLQLAVIGISMAIGLIEFVILRPNPLGPLPWLAGGLLPALAVGVFTGFPEELIFRGVMQSAARPLLGRWNWIYVSAVFAVLHIGYGSIADVLFVFAVGLLYGWVVERTRCIIGVSISHGLANVVLLCIASNMA
jgi:membrane protease YdiL (CAAX protease family)